MNKVTIMTVDNEKREVSMKTIDQIDQKKLVVTQANAIAKSIQKMTLQEKRLLWLAISHIRISDEDFLLYRVPIRHLKEYMGGANDEGFHSYIRQIAVSLLKRVVEVEKENGDWYAFQWLSYCCYRSKGTSDIPEACLEIRMHDTLKPFLLHLKSHFTKFHLFEVSSMPSFNSARIFEILYSSGMYSKTEKKFKRSKFSFKVTDLKNRLGMEGKYRDFRDFRKDVLNRAQKDCEVYSPLVFTWTEETKGRKIVTLHFTVKPNPKFKNEQLSLLNQAEAQEQTVNTEFETAPVSAPKPAQSSFKKPAPGSLCRSRFFFFLTSFATRERYYGFG